jgi:hypothetical protein
VVALEITPPAVVRKQEMMFHVILVRISTLFTSSIETRSQKRKWMRLRSTRERKRDEEENE